jgi:hypothetical protein
MDGFPRETQFRRTAEWLAESLAMAFVSVMVVVSTLRLLGIVS